MPPFELSSCCSCYVFSQYFAYCFSFPVKRVKCSAIFVLTTKTTQPCTWVFLVNGSIICNFAALFPNLVDNSWLWWIMHVILSNQKQKYFKWIINIIVINLILPSSPTLHCQLPSLLKWKIIYCRATNFCVTWRGRSYPFYRQGPCFNTRGTMAFLRSKL